MKRLLCILSGMDAGGAETFLMKVYRKLDRTQYQMDFCINTKEKCFYEDEILSLGGKIYRIPTKSENVKEFRRQLSDVVKNGQYKYVLRITSNAAGFMDLKIAKQAGAEVCCARSSNSSDGGGIKPWIVHRMGRLLYGKYVDVKIAPSDLAAVYTFGRNAYESGQVSILHNGIDLDIFKYDEAAGKEIRAELGIPADTFVVGHVGRFDTQKNHDFLIGIFKEIKKRKDNTVLLLVGEGVLMDLIREKVSELGLTDSVIFTGLRRDVPRLLSSMNLFVFPSFYEGMPNTVIEAQATGLPCVISDTITREANITGAVEYLSLTKDPADWADTAIRIMAGKRKEAAACFMMKKYDIVSVTDEFIKNVFRV